MAFQERWGRGTIRRPASTLVQDCNSPSEISQSCPRTRRKPHFHRHSIPFQIPTEMFPMSVFKVCSHEGLSALHPHLHFQLNYKLMWLPILLWAIRAFAALCPAGQLQIIISTTPVWHQKCRICAHLLDFLWPGNLPLLFLLAE